MRRLPKSSWRYRTTSNVLGPAADPFWTAFYLASDGAAAQYAGSDQYSDLATQKEGFA